MKIKLLVACALVVLGTVDAARAECRIANEDRGAFMVRFFVASHACRIFKKPMQMHDLWALLEGSGSVTGIKDALGGGLEVGNKCMSIVMPFIESKALALGATMEKRKFPDWRPAFKGDPSSLCSAVKTEIDNSDAWRRVFASMGLY